MLARRRAHPHRRHRHRHAVDGKLEDSMDPVTRAVVAAAMFALLLGFVAIL